MTAFHEIIPMMRRWISKLWIIPLFLFQSPELLAHVRLPESPLLTAQYAYDGLGNLLQINETGTIRRLVRDRADELARPLMLTDVSGNAVQTYLWANGSLIAQIETGAVRYAHFNELGHLLALTDESGDVTDEFAYHPYGRLVAHIGTTETPFAYMGAYGVMRVGYDLYLTRHRAYSANLMRWLSVDPIGLDGGWNLYAYAGGNPVYFIDVLGLAQLDPESSGARLAASIGVGFIPFVGTGQSLVELVTGRDYIAGTDASRAFAAVGVVAGLVPAGKAVVKGLSNADDVARIARSVPTDIKVIGRLDDTAVAKGWKGHDVLDIPNWTPQKNMQWVDQGIANKQPFYTASPQAGNMIQTSGPFKGQPTIYAQELQRIQNAGYIPMGDYFMHPLGTFKP